LEYGKTVAFSFKFKILSNIKQAIGILMQGIRIEKMIFSLHISSYLIHFFLIKMEEHLIYHVLSVLEFQSVIILPRSAAPVGERITANMDHMCFLNQSHHSFDVIEFIS